MSSVDEEYQTLLQRLAKRGSYELTAKSRDISKLTGMLQLLSDLGEPHKTGKVVHIAGTTGKGLTGAMITAILLEEGFSTGFYSSPHIADIRERICLQGQWISKKQFTQHAQRVLDQAESYGDRIYLSYFDILTAVAFLAFQEAQMQYVVLETGLGGRADSTNVTNKVLSVITSIGYDHINVLGNSLEAIAHEKLGIVRQGIPTVLAKQAETLKPWLSEQLQNLQSPLILAEQLSLEKTNTGQYQFCWPDGQLDCLTLPRQQSTLPYLACLQTALMAYQTLSPTSSSPQRRSWIQAAAAIKLPGRLEYFEKVTWQEQAPPFPFMVFDGGHNATAVDALSHQLRLWQINNYILVLGFAEDKLIDPLKPSLKTLCQNAQQIIVTQAQSSRAASPEKLADFIRSLYLEQTLVNIKMCASSQETLVQLSSYAVHPIVITGSFYLIGEFFQALRLGLHL